MSVNDEYIIGIDLGTTNSVVSYYDRRSNSLVVINNGGKQVFPSTVRYNSDDSIETCVDLSSVSLIGVAYNSKRLIGRSFHSKEVEKLQNLCGSTVVEMETCSNVDKNSPIHQPGYYISTIKRNVSALKVSSEIIKTLKEKAEMYVNHSVRKAVITTPVNFSYTQRLDTKRAAEMAGLEVISMPAEPTMAVLNYCHSKNFKKGVILVYDFGGGTFDASLCQVDGCTYSILLIDGSNHLGGDDITNAIVREIEKKIDPLSTNPYDKLNSSMIKSIRRKIKTRAEQIKCILGEKGGTEILDLSKIYSEWKKSIDINLEISEINEIVNKTADICCNIVKKAGVDVDCVLMIGGSSHMYLCNRVMENRFPNKIYRDTDISQCVSMGASLYSQLYIDQFHYCDGVLRIKEKLKSRLGYLDAKSRPIYFMENGKSIPAKKEVKVTKVDDDRRLFTSLIEEDEEETNYHVIKDLNIEIPIGISRTGVFIFEFLVTDDSLLYYCVKKNNVVIIKLCPVHYGSY